MDEFEKALDEYKDACIADARFSRAWTREEKQEARARVIALHRAALEDAERLNWLVSMGYWFGGSRDGELVWLMRLAYANDDSADLTIERVGSSYRCSREAIDAVRRKCNCDVPYHVADCSHAARSKS